MKYVKYITYSNKHSKDIYKIFFYKNGIRTAINYYKSGKLKEKSYLKDGLLDHASKPATISYYNNKNNSMSYFGFYKNGYLCSGHVMNVGSCGFHTNGNIQYFHVVDNLNPNFPSCGSFDKNGNFISCEFYKDGVYEELSYYNSNNLYSKSFFDLDGPFNKDGKYHKVFYKNSKKQNIKHYIYIKNGVYIIYKNDKDLEKKIKLLNIS